MKKTIKIVLLGSIPKGDKARLDWVDWKEDYVKAIIKAIPQAKFLHGDLISDKVGSQLVVGHDLWLIKHADIVIVNAISKIGAGTAQEMVLAKKFKKPLIAIIPKNTHHRKTDIIFHRTKIKDWIHPFLHLSADVIVEDIGQAIKWIKRYSAKPLKPKGISIFDEAIAQFEKKLPKTYK